MSLLRSLHQYAKSHSLERDAYFKETEIEWLLCVNKDLSVHLERLRGPRKGRGMPYHMPIPLKRCSGILPNFPADTPGYTLGMTFPDEKERSDPNWHLKCHEAYITSLERAALDCGDEALVLIAKAMRKHQGTFTKLKNAQDVTKIDSVCPATLNKGIWTPVSERPLVRASWVKNYPILQKMVAGRGICMVTGEEADLARIHPLVTGVEGGKSTGVTLITFNAPSGQSFGKKQGENAPVSVDVAILASSALSRILSRQSGKRRSIEIEHGLHMAFIPKKEDEEKAAAFVLSLLDPIEDDFYPDTEGFETRDRKVWKSHRELFNVTGTGLMVPGPDTAVDILLTRVRPSSARIEILRSQEGTFGQIHDNCKAYFNDLEIADPWTGTVRSDFPLKTIWSKEKGAKKGPLARGLLDALKANVKDDESGARPETAAGMFLAAIEGRPLPPEILSLALAAAARQARQGNGIPTAVAALLKIYINRDYTRPESHLMYRWRALDPNYKGVNPMLDVSCKVPSYVLGRLLAAAERIQEIAIPDVTCSVVKRLFDGLSKSPGTLMPTVLRDMNHHFAKIMRRKPRLGRWCHKLAGEILGLLPADKDKAFPKNMDRQDQALFDLGYFHQRTDLFTKKPEKEVEPKPELQEA